MSSTSKLSKKERLKKIIQVFLKYKVLQNLSKQQNPDEVRKAFEELGPTFIKIGQMLSVRTDLLSPAFLESFKKLQDNVKSDPFDEVKQLLESELKQPITTIFRAFDELPLASASIGQVHRAVLKSGAEVVVKVQHPGIIEEIHVDLNLFEKALPLIRYIPESNVVDLKSVLKELRRSLDNETNFLKETKNAQEFYRNNNGWRQVRVPKVYPEFCTEKIIVLQMMPGQSLSHLLEQKGDTLIYPNKTAKELKKEIGTLLVESFIKQVFDDGYFHADPHPGNVFLHLLSETENQQDNFGVKQRVGVLGGVDYSLKWENKQTLPPYRLIYLDFGMMGHLDLNLRNRLADTLLALYAQDTQAVSKAVLRLCHRDGDFDEFHYTQDLAAFVENYYDLPIKEIDLQEVLGEIIKICHDNNLQLDREVTMLIKAFSTLEGVIEELDPELSMMEITQPFAARYFIQHLDVKEEIKKSMLDSAKSIRALSRIPDRTLSALETFANGKSRLNLEFRQQTQLLDRLDLMVNRLIAGIIIAAVILGSSLLVDATPDEGPAFIHHLGILGYIVSFLVILFVALRHLYRKIRKK